MTTGETIMLAGGVVAAAFILKRMRETQGQTMPLSVGPSAASPQSTLEKICEIGVVGAGAYNGGPGGAQAAGQVAPAACPGLEKAARAAAARAKDVAKTGFLLPVTVTVGAYEGAKKVLGIDTDDRNCSVAQQPENAAWCRQRFGLASAPGSDAWAREHGMRPVLTGPGST